MRGSSALSQSPAQNPWQQRQKLLQTSLLVGVARDGDPVPGFQPELSLATSSRGTLAACPCFWAAHHQHSTAQPSQASRTPNLPCTLQALRPLPVPTTCARGQSHLCPVLLRKGFKLSPASASFLPSCCLFHPGCELQGGFEGLGKGNKLKGLKKKCGLLNVPSLTCTTHFNTQLQEQGWLWCCCDG